MLHDIPPFLIRTLLGFGLGVVLGIVARRGRFCTLGAIEDAVYGNDTRRIRAWILATGFSTLSFGSILAAASILLGARVGLYWLVER
jgi:hypothetical protein